MMAGPRATVLGSARRLGARGSLALTGGVEISGNRPAGGCVIVANHRSHADTLALLAGLNGRVSVAAAADHWFGDPAHAIAARAIGAFPVDRTHGGGCAALTAAARPLLDAGHAVVVFPEGTRSRSGQVGDWHSGAFRLAEAAGVPVVPVGLVGTAILAPVHGYGSRAPLAVRIGAPVATLERARAAVARLEAAPARPSSRVRAAVAGFAHSRKALLLIAFWAFAEALCWPIVPEVAVGVLVLAAPRSVLRLTFTAIAASVAGITLAASMAAHGATLPQPLTTAAMRDTVATQVAFHGSAALWQQPLSGIPVKVYARQIGRHEEHPLVTAGYAAGARGARLGVIALLCAAAGSLPLMRRFYPAVVAGALAAFSCGLVAVVTHWGSP